MGAPYEKYLIVIVGCARDTLQEKINLGNMNY